MIRHSLLGTRSLLGACQHTRTCSHALLSPSSPSTSDSSSPDTAPSTSSSRSGPHGCWSTAPGAVRHASTWRPWTWLSSLRGGSQSQQHNTSGQELSLQGEQGPLDGASGMPDINHFPETTEAFLATLQATNAGEHAAIAAAKADAFFTSSWCMEAFQYAHDSWGLPWWGSIATVTLMSRMATIPLAVYSQKVTAGMAVIQKNLLPAKKLQQLAQQTSDATMRDRYMKAAQKVVSEHFAVHGDPRKKILTVPLVLSGSGIVFISIFNGVRNLMGSGAHSLTQGGMLWFNDLTSPDPYFGLPILCAVATMGMVHYGTNLGGADSVASVNAQQAKIMKYVLMGASLVFIPAGNYVSAGVAVLWTVNSSFAIVQGLALRNSAVRRVLGLPTTEEMKKISREIAAANETSQSVNMDAEKSLAERAAEAEKKLGTDASGKVLLFTQSPQPQKQRPKRSSSSGSGRL